MIAARSGTSAYFNCAAGFDRRHRRDGCRRQALGRDLVTQQRGIGRERFVELPVGQLHPPREERIVAVVEREPLARDGAQLVDGRRPELRLLLAHARRGRRQLLQLLRDVGEHACGLLRIDVLDADASLDELHQLRRERHAQQRLGARPRVLIQPLLIRLDGLLQRGELRLRRRRQLRRGKAVERRLPVHVEPLEAREPPGRQRHERRRWRCAPLPAPPPAAAAAPHRAVGVVAGERIAVERVALDHHPHLARRSGEQRRQIRRNRLLLRRGAEGQRDNEQGHRWQQSAKRVHAGEILLGHSLSRLAATSAVVRLMGISMRGRRAQDIFTGPRAIHDRSPGEAGACATIGVCADGRAGRKARPNSVSSRIAPVAQLDRASASGAEGCRFEPCRVHQPSLTRKRSCA